MSDNETAQVLPARRSRRPRGLTIAAVLIVLFGVPWWTLVGAGTQWPGVVVVAATILFINGLLALPLLMYLGHGRRSRDWAARIGDAILGVIWVLFTWALLGNLLRLALAIGGIADPLRSRIVAVAVITVSLALMLWGCIEAMRVPRIKFVTVTIGRLARGLHGVRLVLLTDTHFGPINRTRWSTAVVAAVNALDADIVCHTGDIADGSVVKRRQQAAALANVRAKHAKVYVLGNHEHFGWAQTWLEHMRRLGWEPLHNRHMVVHRDGAALVVAGVDDATAVAPSHYAAALAGVDPNQPVVLLAHQPKQIDAAIELDIDLQLSGHTHGGQIWPFHLLVRLVQPSLHGLTRHGERTQLYTSRGTGFWGPPLRIFAPSEITVLTLNG
ncbi:MAG: metallophosphoesterase [Nitrococcus sp.]|nr:metallophosphoesterase [Nitrococcus sp.]